MTGTIPTGATPAIVHNERVVWVPFSDDEEDGTTHIVQKHRNKMWASSHQISVLETMSPAFDRALVEWLGDFGRCHDDEAAKSLATLETAIAEIVADVILFAFLTGLAYTVVLTLGFPSWQLAIGTGALAVLLVRWLAPILVISWLKHYAASFQQR